MFLSKLRGLGVGWKVENVGVLDAVVPDGRVTPSDVGHPSAVLAVAGWLPGREIISGSECPHSDQMDGRSGARPHRVLRRPPLS